MAEIADARHRGLLVQPHAAMARTGHHRAIVRDGKPRTDAGRMIDVLRLAGADAHLLDDLFHEIRHAHRILAAKIDLGLLLHDVDAAAAFARIVRLDKRTDAI